MHPTLGLMNVINISTLSVFSHQKMGGWKIKVYVKYRGVCYSLVSSDMGDLRDNCGWEWPQGHPLYFSCNHWFDCSTVTLVDSWTKSLTRFRYTLSRESLPSLARRIGLCNSVQRRIWVCHPQIKETACLLSFSYTSAVFVEMPYLF